MARDIKYEAEQFVVDKRTFPIVINYNKQPAQMVHEMPLAWCVSSLLYEKIKILREGIKEINCFYVIVGREGTSFEQVVAFCADKKIALAKAEHLFAFGKRYPEEYDERIGNNRIIAGGSTWLDSHECLDEMLALSWTTFYHAPGRELSVVCDLGSEISFGLRGPAFIAGDRFLAVKE